MFSRTGTNPVSSHEHDIYLCMALLCTLVISGWTERGTFLTHNLIICVLLLSHKNSKDSKLNNFMLGLKCLQNAATLYTYFSKKRVLVNLQMQFFQ